MSDAFLISLIHSFQNKLTVIRLVDENVDGCGTDVDAIISVIGPAVTKSTLDGIRKAVDEYKEEEPYWDSDECFDAARAYLTKEGYEVVFHTPDIRLAL